MTERSYHSPLRREQAARTREQIVDAARELFTAHGFDATTVAMIAQRAGVSEPTVYKVFGSKGALLRALLRRVELDADVDAWRERIAAEVEPRRRIALFAQWSAQLFSRGRDVITAARDAQGVAEVAELWQHGEGNRRGAVDRVVDGVQRAGALRGDLDARQAGERAWLLSGPELYLLAVDRLGWSDEGYVAWLTELLFHELLADGAGATADGRRSRPGPDAPRPRGMRGDSA